MHVIGKKRGTSKQIVVKPYLEQLERMLEQS